MNHSSTTTQNEANNKRPSRKAPGSPRSRQSANHVENERQRREKMNRRFCELRAAVPNVSRMDKTSLLADATAYINQLRARVAQLEEQARQLAAARRDSPCSSPRVAAAGASELVQVSMAATEVAVVRVISAAQHAPASLMAALRSLELQVRHACVSRVNGITTQDVVVDVPSSAAGALLDDYSLRAALLERMMHHSA